MFNNLIITLLLRTNRKETSVEQQKLQFVNVFNREKINSV